MYSHLHGDRLRSRNGNIKESSCPVAGSFPGGSVVKESIRQCRRPRVNPWVRRICWRRKQQHTAVFLPGKAHGPRSLAGHSPWGHKELDATERRPGESERCPELALQVWPQPVNPSAESCLCARRVVTQVQGLPGNNAAPIGVTLGLFSGECELYSKQCFFRAYSPLK